MASLRTSRQNVLFLLLLAAALAMRALLPGGTMLGADRAGELAITLCNSEAMLVIPMKDKAPSPADDASQSQCAFVHLGDNSIPPDPLARPALPQLAEAAWNATRQRALSPATAPSLPLATGPPAFV